MQVCHHLRNFSYLSFSRFSAFRYQILVCLGAPPRILSIHSFPLNKTFGDKDRQKKTKRQKKVKKMLFPLNTSYYSGYVYENSGPLESKAGVFSAENVVISPTPSCRQ